MFQCWDQWLVFVTFNPLKNKCIPKHLGWKTRWFSPFPSPKTNSHRTHWDLKLRNIIGSCNDPAVLKRPRCFFFWVVEDLGVQPKIQVHFVFLKKLGPPKVFWDGKFCGGKGDESYPLGYSSRDASCTNEKHHHNHDDSTFSGELSRKSC